MFECAWACVPHTGFGSDTTGGRGWGQNWRSSGSQALQAKVSDDTYFGADLLLLNTYIYIYMYICLYRTWNLYGFVFGIPELHEILWINEHAWHKAVFPSESGCTLQHTLPRHGCCCCCCWLGWLGNTKDEIFNGIVATTQTKCVPKSASFAYVYL